MSIAYLKVLKFFFERKTESLYIYICFDKISIIKVKSDSMGFLDKIFGEKEDDYASKFKKCIENDGSGSERTDILSPWRKEYPNDANMYYATAISESKYWSSSYMQILQFINIAKSKTPQNKRLASWYEKEANKMLKLKQVSDSGKF